MLVLLGASALAPFAAAAQDSIDLYYNERPPYAVTGADGEVHGLTATPAARALQAAGVGFRWVQLPSSRQLAAIRDSRRPECGIGWFRNAEREGFARFSRPLYQDRPTVALAHAGFMPRGPRLADVLESREVVVLVKDTFSYGPYVDGLLVQHKPTTITTTVENAQMVQMVARHRVDFMFAAEEEAAVLLQQAGNDAKSLKIVRFTDVPPGEKRYLMCSRSVSPELIERVNAALPEP